MATISLIYGTIVGSMNDLIRWFREEDTVSLVPLLAIGFLIIVTPIFLGGNGFEGESLLFFLTGPIAYFTWKSDPDAFYRAIRRPVSIVFFLFVCATALSLIPSADRFSSLTSVLNWIALYVIFVSTTIVVDSKKRIYFLVHATILSALILSVVGLYGLLHTSMFGYLRLTSTFDQHNAFGGFLLIPFALLIGRFLESKTRNAVLVWGGFLIVVASTFVLTFSRGSWVSLVFGVGIALIVFRKKVWALVQNRKILAGILGVLILTGGVVFGMLHLTSKLAEAENQGIGVFTGETVENNALTARLQYFRDALRVIRENPLYGIGLRHYGEAVKLYKDTPAFYASSPHNEYLKFFAEIGVFGGLLFIIFILLILAKTGKEALISSKTDDWILSFSLLAGSVAVAVHLGMEVDWGYVANPLLLVALMGAFYGITQKGREIGENNSSVRGVAILLLLGAVTVSMVGIGYWYQMYHIEQGVILLHQDKLGDAFLEFKEAHRFSDYNSGPHYFSALTLEKAAHLTSDTTKQKQFLLQASEEISSAIVLKPKKPLYYSWQALIYQELGNEEGYRKALEMTIKYNPVEGVYEYAQLTALYNVEKRYKDCIAIAEKILPYYPLELYNNPYWENPDKGLVRKQIASIYTQLSLAYTKTGDVVRAKEAKEKALLYNPSSVK